MLALLILLCTLAHVRWVLALALLLSRLQLLLSVAFLTLPPPMPLFLDALGLRKHALLAQRLGTFRLFLLFLALLPPLPLFFYARCFCKNALLTQYLGTLRLVLLCSLALTICLGLLCGFLRDSSALVLCTLSFVLLCSLAPTLFLGTLRLVLLCSLTSTICLGLLGGFLCGSLA